MITAHDARSSTITMSRRWTTLTLAAVAVCVYGASLAAQAGTPRMLSTVPDAPPGASAVPADMSGVPLQVGDLPPGVVTVRVIRRSFDNNVSNQPVKIRRDRTGEVFESLTDATGRAWFQELAIGETVRAQTTLEEETLESQSFALPSGGGVRLVLAAGVGAGSAAAPWTLAAAVTSGRATAAAPTFLPSVQVIFALLIGAFVLMLVTVVRSTRRPSGDQDV
jgi:hypothetical protein